MAELITMTQKELSRHEVIRRLIRKGINGSEVAKQMDLSVLSNHFGNEMNRLAGTPKIRHRMYPRDILK